MPGFIIFIYVCCTIPIIKNNPAYLRRKRQKTNGDPVHLLLQQQKNPHQNDHQDDRQTYNTSGWNGLNIPAIKMEPRDSSPQSFGIYRTLPELTPSPQPLSPSSAYNHNTKSPYNTTEAVTSHGNQQLMSPNRQYNTNNVAANNNLNNLNSANTYSMYNLLMPANACYQGNYINGNGSAWNLEHNPFHPHMHHLQQQCQQHDTVAIINNTVVAQSNINNGSMENKNNSSSNDVTNNQSNEHGLSNLLTFDSDQLVRINSEDQQMLRLNSEDLQISNLSIST